MMRKRMLSLLCVLALCLGLLPVTALADDALVATVEISGTTTEYSIDTNYTTAEAALLAAWTACQGQTATLTLMQDVELDSRLVVNASTNLTLCMDDGVTLTSAYSGNNGCLYIQGSLDFQSGTIQADAPVSDFSIIRLYQTGAEVTLSGGKIALNGNSNKSYGVSIMQGTFRMTGGSITTTGTDNAYGVYLNNGTAVADISGGTISSASFGVYANYGSVTISGNPEISSSDRYAVYVSSATAQLSGGTFSGGQGSIWVTTTGKTVKNLLVNGYAYYDGNGGKISNTDVQQLSSPVTVQSDSAGELKITTQPVGKNAEIGGSATFEVVVSGGTPLYQWEVSEDNGATWTSIQGANEATLTISNATLDMAGNLYRCVVSDANDSSVTLPSANAILTVNNCYRLTVIGSTGSSYSYYKSGAEVTISAPVEDSDGGYFWKWASDDVTISSPSTITNTFTMPSGNVTVTARYSDVIAIDGYMTKEDFVEAAEALLNEKVSSDVTWSNTIDSDNITKAGDFTFTATDSSDNQYEYGIMAKQTMAQIDMGSKVGEGNCAYDEDTKTLTVTAGSKSYEVSFGTEEITVCENYVYVPISALEKYTDKDAVKTGYRLNMTITGDNAENAYPVLVSGSGYKYVEEYEKSAGSAVVVPESYLTDAKTGQSVYAIPVVIDKYGAINVWFSQQRILSFDGTGSEKTFSFNGTAWDGRTYTETEVSSYNFGASGKVFFKVNPPDGEARAWAVLIVPSDKVDDDTTGSGVTIDTSWDRSQTVDMDHGHSYYPYSLFQNSAGQFAAVYLKDDTTAVISEIKLTENQTDSVAPGETATLSVTADYQFKDRMPGVIYQWYTCDKDGNNAQAISGANAATYTTSNLAADEYYYYVTAQFAQFEESNIYFDEYGNKFLDNASFGWASNTVTRSAVFTVPVGDAVNLTADVNKNTFKEGENLTVEATVAKAAGATSASTPTGKITLYWGDPTADGSQKIAEGTLNDGKAAISYTITKEDIESGSDKTLYIRYSGDSNYRSAMVAKEIRLLGGLTITATPGTGSVTISWEAPAGYDNIDHYELSVSAEGVWNIGGKPFEIAEGQTSYTVTTYTDQSTPLYAGIPHQFILTAVLTDGSKVISNTATATPKQVSSGSSDDSDEASYPVNISQEIDHGSVHSSHRTAEAGTTVTLTITPDEGCELVRLTVTDSKGNQIDLTDKGDGKFTFTMPAGKVTVEAVFAPITPRYDDCPRDETCPIWPFTDASTTAWYHNGVHYCLDEGLMKGITAASFSPNGSVTRQQVWMILARLSGADPADMAEARTWAMANGVSDGTNPGSPVTRQQFAAMMYRYAVQSGMAAVTLEENLSGFPDAADVAEYAVQAMNWAVGQGIIGGMTDGTLNPTGPSTRAQTAVMLCRWLA